MYTKTITLSGAELSSFIAAGGQTVNPDAAAATVQTAVTQVPFPTVADTVATTSAAQVVVAPTTTTTPSRPTLITTTTPIASVTPSSTSTVSTTSTTPTTTSLSSATTSSTVILATTTSLMTSSAKLTSSAKPTALISSARAGVASAGRAIGTARASSASSSARKIGSSALSASSKSKGVSGGGIAGIIIGLLLLFGIVGAVLFFLRKRRKNRDTDSERSRSQLKNEKGMVQLNEEEIATPSANSNNGFDFGNLAPIPTSQLNYDANSFSNTRSASPAQMQQGAAVLGIQRPFTPPPGHPAHPNYRQPPALAAAQPIRQQQQRGLSPPGHNQATVPRKPIAVAPAAQNQRQLSSNNPFNDPPAEAEVAPALAHSTSPVVDHASNTNAENPQGEAAPRASLDSFSAGDDSFEAQDDVALAANAEHVAQVERTAQPAPARETIPVPPVPENKPTTESAQTEDGQVARTKSVIAATDNWAARKAHLKNTLALQSASNPTSPVPEQSPFADPVPTIDHEIAALSPMKLEFSSQNEETKM